MYLSQPDALSRWRRSYLCDKGCVYILNVHLSDLQEVIRALGWAGSALDGSHERMEPQPGQPIGSAIPHGRRWLWYQAYL